MKLTIAAVGRLKAEYAIQGCEQFRHRLSRYFDLNYIETKDIKRKAGGTQAVKLSEGQALLKALPSGCVKVILDERGRSWSTQTLVEWLEKQKNTGASSIAFLIGGPDGHAEETRKQGQVVWSLSPLTFPHELARLVLMEQLYRAATVMSGHPYHRP